jgi:hypothetical protein
MNFDIDAPCRLRRVASLRAEARASGELLCPYGFDDLFSRRLLGAREVCAGRQDDAANKRPDDCRSPPIGPMNPHGAFSSRMSSPNFRPDE